MSGAMLPPCE